MRKSDDSRNMELYGEEDDLFGAEYDTDQIEDVLARHLWALTAIQSNTFFRVHQMHQINFRYKTPVMNTPPATENKTVVGGFFFLSATVIILN